MTRMVFVIVLCIFASALWAQDLPNPKTSGAGGGPIAILFLSSRPQNPVFDPQYAKSLSEHGFVFTHRMAHEPLTYEYLKKFNVIVLDSLSEANADATWTTGGVSMRGYNYTMTGVKRCLEEGVGVLVYPNLVGTGRGQCVGWNVNMKPFGAQIIHGCIRDVDRTFAKWNYWCDNGYTWTKNLADHPLTRGLKRIYYVGADHRAWMENYSTPPLLCDTNWTPLVKAMPTARIYTQCDGTWDEEPEQPKELVMAAVRTVGQGRMAAITINPEYLHRMGYESLKTGHSGEASYGVINGIVLEKGDGQIPSDVNALLLRLYRWLAGDSTKKGFGGYKAGDPVVKNDEALKGPWFKDPKWMKVLIGAHSVHSDGRGTVAEYAAAAKQAGYAAIAFTENFERLTRPQWDALVRDCIANSTEDFVCLPGYEIMDPYDNRFLIIGPPIYPRAQWLTPDGKRIVKTHMMNTPLYNHTVVAHRATKGSVPYERLKHVHGISLYTYRGDKLVDDSRTAYVWQIQSSSNPLPYAVHEVFSPAEVAVAARTGFQQMWKGDTPALAVKWSRYGDGLASGRGLPFRISEGPVITQWTCYGHPDARHHQIVLISATSETPLKEVILYDSFKVVRRLKVTENSVDLSTAMQWGWQYGLYAEVVDQQGRRAITSPIGTNSGRHHWRCYDKQNWLGDIGYYYTGGLLPYYFNIWMPVKGTDEGRSIIPSTRGAVQAIKLNFPFSCADVLLTQLNFGEVYSHALWAEIGLDGTPSLPSEPSKLFDGRIRHWSFTPDVPGQSYIALVETSLRLKRDVEPEKCDGLFPGIGAILGNKFCRWTEEGRFVSGAVDGRTIMDIPVGSIAGGIIPLSEGIQINKGRYGFAFTEGPGKTLPKGTEFKARYLIAGNKVFVHEAPRKFDDNPEEWLKVMGFAGKTPYTFTLSRGTLEKVAFFAYVKPENYGVAGEVTEPADIPYRIPLEMPGVNERWLIGIWQEGEPLLFGGVFEGKAWPRLSVAKKGKFYAGNLITADNKELFLDVIKWTPTEIKVEAHNPTDGTITATLSTPPEITGLRALKWRVVLPPGTSEVIEDE